MNNLSKVFVFKIAITIFAWCIPFLLFPPYVLKLIGLPDQQPSYMFIRLLGWAYIALCVGYYFGLQASLAGKRSMSAIWVGIVSNGGASLYMLYFGLAGTWVDWGILFQGLAWGSAVATGLITAGLYIYGVLGDEPVAE